MAISMFPNYERERSIIRVLEGVSGDEWKRVQSITGIVTDIKQSSGRWTLAYILQKLYQYNPDKLEKNAAGLTLAGGQFNPPPIDEFEVLSAIWPAISELGVVDDKLLRLTKKALMLTGQDFYSNQRI